jgi:peptide alpha-N-acetyltransferase
LPKQEEAEHLARTAIKKDITSHITWHVLGILAKVRKDWEEASRAFAMARKQDADNVPLIRDSIALYLHTRQYAAAASARHHHMTIRPNLRSSWLGLVVAHHLNGDLEEAVEVWDAFERTVKNDGFAPTEKAQMGMYVIRVCMESGDYEDGLRRLESGLRNGSLHARGEVTALKGECLATKMRRNG